MAGLRVVLNVPSTCGCPTSSHNMSINIKDNTVTVKGPSCCDSPLDTDKKISINVRNKLITVDGAQYSKIYLNNKKISTMAEVVIIPPKMENTQNQVNVTVNVGDKVIVKVDRIENSNLHLHGVDDQPQVDPVKDGETILEVQEGQHSYEK